MKNIIKKSLAVVTAFTMIATGSVLSQNDELTIHATTCNHNCRRYKISCPNGPWETYKSKPGIDYQRRKVGDVHCSSCGKDVGNAYQYREHSTLLKLE